MNATEFLISFSIIMMMLSLISERASNFAKLYFQGKTIYIPFLYKLNKKWITHLKVRLDILAYKQPTVAGEKEREYRLMVINILIGISIATLANANLFEIIRSIKKQVKTLPISGYDISIMETKHIIGFLYMLFFLWSISIILFSRLPEYETKIKIKNYKYPFLIWIVLSIILVTIGFLLKKAWCLSIITHTLGFIFVGLFISLGSKFWHDLLGILFKLKNTQQVLSDSKTYTDYDSEDQLLALADTSQYDVVEQLFELYKNEIVAIEGVVSYGLNTILDEKTKLYKKIIEVEFINDEAQDQLQRIKFTGSVTLKYNTFFLKDYLVYKYTSQLIALSSIEDTPKCYAYNANPSNLNPSKGSFSVYKDGDNYFAISNLHVFADDDEFKNFENNATYNLNHRTVQFVVDNNITQKGTIVDYKFGSFEGYGIDLCVCRVDKELYDLFIEYIDIDKLIDINEYSMRMFGAYTKYTNFHSFRKPTTCYVEYNGFRNRKELYLFKIAVSSIGIKNIGKGDSGSTVYYKIKNKNTILLATGIIVSKSDDYAYIFRGELLTNTNKLELWKN
ncbi:hypothetical protein [Flavobacterium sp. J27]|uniref:hypothetical protein n=1 Tax=Flavobacterium sp. J27 TaxID=2060419 RepID=UPI0010327123|nr:hypothetical protein [Flavobacterium sp. J27]